MYEHDKRGLCVSEKDGCIASVLSAGVKRVCWSVFDMRMQHDAEWETYVLNGICQVNPGFPAANAMFIDGHFCASLEHFCFCCRQLAALLVCARLNLDGACGSERPPLLLSSHTEKEAMFFNGKE